MANEVPQSGDVATRRRRVWFWPVLVCALLGGQILILAVMVYMATSDRSFAVEPDYYRKGLHWDEAAAQERANAALGWSLELKLGDTLGPLGERLVSCELTGRNGVTLAGADVRLIAFHHARGNERFELALTGDGTGTYAAEMRFRRKGLWEFRFTVERGPETFTYMEQRDVYPPGESRPWRP